VVKGMERAIKPSFLLIPFNFPVPPHGRLLVYCAERVYYKKYTIERVSCTVRKSRSHGSQFGGHSHRRSEVTSRDWIL